MEKDIFEKEFKALGTDIYIQVVGAENKREEILWIFNEVENIYKEKESIFSRFNPESELSRLNNNLGVFNKVSAELKYLAQESLRYYLQSEKIFDPRILSKLEKIGYKNNFTDNNFEEDDLLSDEAFETDLKNDLVLEGDKIKIFKKMDFSGVAKGYITDKVASFLAANGWENFLVDSGGDMYASGLNRYEEKWGIALEGTENEDEILAEISNEGLATSGNTRKHWEINGKKFHHLINPENVNHFGFALKSVTVIAKTTQEADVLAKVLFILGPTAGLEFANKNKIKSIFLKDNKEVFKANL